MYRYHPTTHVGCCGIRECRVADNGVLITEIRTQTNALAIFIVLQCLDVLTTLIFLSKGMAEGNPLMGLALSTSHAPWLGLTVSKMIAVIIGQYCYRSGRLRLLRRANAGYSVVVGWNLVGIIAALSATR
jgi:hypothetical protein